MKIRDADIKSSLDLLDEVIGEFDDGLTSAAESDIVLGTSVTTPVIKRNQRHRYRNDNESQDKISSRVNGANNYHQNKHNPNSDKEPQLVEEPIRANVRNFHSPAQLPKKLRDQSAPPYLSGGKPKQAGQPVLQHRSQVLNNHIDDIFSELTNEIYVEDKRERKSAKRTTNVTKNNERAVKRESNLSFNGHDPNKKANSGTSHVSAKRRQRSPPAAPTLPQSSIISVASYAGSSAGSQSTRHVNDPLPAPPTSTRGGSSNGMVSSLAAKLSSGKENNVGVVTNHKSEDEVNEGNTITEEERRKEELAAIIAAKKSVKDQIHSLEARGRIISIRPEDRFQRNRNANHGERFQQEAEEQSKLHGQPPQNQRFRGNKGQPSLPARSRSENPINRSRAGGAFTYLPTTSEDPVGLGAITPPPVMPEKTKIHLKSHQQSSPSQSVERKRSQQERIKTVTNSNASKNGSGDVLLSTKNKRVKDVKSQNAKSKSPLKKANQTTNNEKSDLVQRSTASTKNGSRKLADGTTQSKSTSVANNKAKTVTAETRRPNQPLPEIPYQQDHESSAKSSLRMGRVSSQMSSNNYEILQTTNSSSPTASGLSNSREMHIAAEGNRRYNHKSVIDPSSTRRSREEYRKQHSAADYKRTRSLGPLSDALYGDELSSPASSRTREPLTKPSINHFDHSPSEYPDMHHDEGRGRPRSRSRHANNIELDMDSPSSASRHPAMIRSHTTIEPRDIASYKANSRINNFDHSVGVKHMHSPPSPTEAQATLEKMLPRLHGQHGGMGNRMPSRQKSMIDLREQIVPPMWPDHPRNRHIPGGIQYPSPHVPPLLSHPSLPPQAVHPHITSRAPASMHHTTVDGNIPLNAGHNHPPSMQKSVESGAHRRLSAMGRSSTEHDMKIRSRRSMAVGPFEDLPPHIRQHMIRQHGFQMVDDNFLPAGMDFPPMSRSRVNEIEDGSVFARRHNLEAHREFLMRRGFPPSHPYISGEVPIHPELQGQLPFGNPSTRTIPLRPEDYQRFRPDLWLHPSHPNPVQFHDVALLQNELEVRRRRIAQQQQVQLIRRESQRERDSQIASSHHRLPESSKMKQPNNSSSVFVSPAIENNFNSMPWEEILPKRMEHLHHQALQSVREMDEQQQRTRSQEGRNRGNSKSSRPFAGLMGGGRNATGGERDEHSENGKTSWFGGGGPFTGSNTRKEGKGKRKGGGRDKSAGIEDENDRGHWLLKEKTLDETSLPPDMAVPSASVGVISERDIHQSMPPINVGGGIGTLRDSGIGDDYPSPSHNTALKDSSNDNLNRNGTDRSSFGMILKDKFQRNPNMYFPGDQTNKCDGGRSSNSSGQSDRSGSRNKQDKGADGGRRSNNSSNSAGSASKTSGTCTTSATTSIIVTGREGEKRHNQEEIVAEMDVGMLSDTDTLIHNMSDGSYEEDGESGVHNSIGKESSGKGSRGSSGSSSLSPHNSMEGSPRMMPKPQSTKKKPSATSLHSNNKHQPDRVPTASNHAPSGSRSLVVVEATPSGGTSIKTSTGGKKTIRNYTPKESSNMLREFENLRNNSVDWRNKQNKKAVINKNITKSSPSEAKIGEEKAKKNGTGLERKSSVEKMIDDFHRNLPPPPPDPRLTAITQSNNLNLSSTDSINHTIDSPSTSDRKTRTGLSNTGAEKRSATKVVPVSSSSAVLPMTHNRSRNTPHLNGTTNKQGTLTSQVSNWSVASSSAASFDYQPGTITGAPGNTTAYNKKKYSSTDNLLPALSEVEYGGSNACPEISNNNIKSRIGERVPPEGCAAISNDSPQPQSSFFIQRIEVKSGSSTAAASQIGKNNPKEEKDSRNSNHSKVDSGIVETDDEFSNLRKMISEGRIAGLNDKPPSFIPPTPPSTTKQSFSSKSSITTSNSSSPKPNVPSNTTSDTRNDRNKRNKHSKLVERSSSSITGNQKTTNSPRRTNSNKPPAPATPKLNIEKSRGISVSVTSLDKQRHVSGGSRIEQCNIERSTFGELNSSGRARKAKPEAPKPPGFAKTSTQKTPNETFHKRESLEDLTQMDVRRKNEIKRSASNHGNRPTQGFGKGGAEDSNMAKLIADSTEKKFNFNPFKGMLKKKHYSFDFN